ncbi:hypothetical protein F8274_11060 [Micromonospora sp. AMSO31t]|nr:hypothetical protein F8274_11060 [Micromonospora sp. AMSO31t]
MALPALFAAALAAVFGRRRK